MRTRRTRGLGPVVAAAVLALVVGAVVCGRRADTAEREADRLAPVIGHLVLRTGTLVEVRDEGVPSYAGTYRVRLDNPIAGGPDELDLEGAGEWATSADRADVPQTYDFVLDTRSRRVVESGGTGTLTVPTATTVADLRGTATANRTTSRTAAGLAALLAALACWGLWRLSAAASSRRSSA